MKKIILFLLLFVLSEFKLFGQIYERTKPIFVSTQHRVHLYGIYNMGKDGLYVYNDFGEEKPVSPDDFLKMSEGNERFFSYDKKNNRCYFYTDNVIGYYSPTKVAEMNETKKYIKIYNVPLVSLEDVKQIKNNARKLLDDIYSKKNDSIIEQRRIAREKQINDSIEAMKIKEEGYEEFRKTHSWHNLNLGGDVFMQCRFCNDIYRDDEIYVLSLSSDTIYYLREKPDIEILGKAFSVLHYNEITSGLRNNKNFKEYIHIWRDSIAQNNKLNNAEAAKINLYRYLQIKEEINKIAPYGYIDKWGWDLNSAYGVEPYFTFYNTTNKIIKYVDFYYTLYNAVGDKCYLSLSRSYTGHVRGVGPVEPDESSIWNWERATDYTSADATEMRITKIVITYMDKTVKTLTGNAILFNN